MKRAAIILFLVVFLLVGCGTPPEDDTVKTAETTGTDITKEDTANQTEDTEYIDYGENLSVLISESDSGNVYLIFESFYITLESKMFMESSIIYDDEKFEYGGNMINRKVGEIRPSVEFGNGEKASDYFTDPDFSDTDEGVEVIVENASYKNNSGKTIYYQVLGLSIMGAPSFIYGYNYLVPLFDNTYASFCLWSYQDNRSADETRFRAIVDSIVLA